MVPIVLNRVARKSVSGVTIVALCAAALCVAGIWLPTKRTAAPIPLPAASAVAPGVGIDVDYSGGSSEMGCTAGFLERTGASEAGLLTAGHCNRTGKASKAAINVGGSHYVTVGKFHDTIGEGTRSDEHDIGLVVLDGEQLPRSSKTGGTLPVSGVTSRLQLGESLCALGMKTGTAQRGPIVILNQGFVVFRAGGQCGDSGAPVYLITEGTASAVGIITRGGDPNHPDAGCSTPGTFSAAWLDEWNLTASPRRMGNHDRRPRGPRPARRKASDTGRVIHRLNPLALGRV